MVLEKKKAISRINSQLCWILLSSSKMQTDAIIGLGDMDGLDKGNVSGETGKEAMRFVAERLVQVKEGRTIRAKSLMRPEGWMQITSGGLGIWLFYPW